MNKKIIIMFFLIIISNLYAQDSIDVIILENQSTNKSMDESLNQSVIENLSEIKHSDIELLKFFPKEVKLGDVQFNLQIKNNKNQSLENVLAYIFGNGFSTYDIISIENLETNGKDYIFVNGNFRESGEINLTIKIEGYTFYQKVSVIDINEGIEKTDEELDLEKLNNLNIQLEDLKKNYTDLEIAILEKKEERYDVLNINLDELKKNIRTVDADILRKDVNLAEINFKLALEEYEFQKEKLDKAKIMPLINRIKENALVFSAIFGTILAFFALSELLKKKSGEVVTGVRKFVVKKNKNKRNKTKRI